MRQGRQKWFASSHKEEDVEVNIEQRDTESTIILCVAQKIKTQSCLNYYYLLNVFGSHANDVSVECLEDVTFEYITHALTHRPSFDYIIIIIIIVITILFYNRPDRLGLVLSIFRCVCKRGIPPKTTEHRRTKRTGDYSEREKKKFMSRNGVRVLATSRTSIRIFIKNLKNICISL